MLLGKNRILLRVIETIIHFIGLEYRESNAGDSRQGYRLGSAGYSNPVLKEKCPNERLMPIDILPLTM